MKQKNLPAEVRAFMLSAGVNLVHRVTAKPNNRGHQVYLSELRREVVREAEAAFLPQCETRRDKESLSQRIGEYARRKRSAGLVWQVQRSLRDNDKIAMRLLSERYDDAQEHWDDKEWMMQHRDDFLPASNFPGVMLVAIDFDESAASAVSERDGKVSAGVGVTSTVAAMNARDLGTLTDEAAARLGEACGEYHLLTVKLDGRKAFHEAYLRVVSG